ncbi:MAG: arylsulfotransferase family protein [Solirubrobacteraceae bacterium]
MRKQNAGRTRLIFALLGAAGAAAVLIASLWSAPGSSASSSAVDVFPTPGAQVATPSSQITFRGVPAASLGTIVVTGSSSGNHPGQIVADSDGRGGSFLPTSPFTAGEQVTVATGLNVVGGSGGSFHFTIAIPARPIPGAAPKPATRVRGDVYRLATRRDLIPAAVTVTKLPDHAGSGDLFVAPQNGPFQQGPMILGPYGGLVWFQPVPKGQSATDFRVQSYRGQPVLTWWQGVVSHAGTGAGEDQIYDHAYRPVATVRAGNGLSADLHEFQLTPQNTALITAYDSVYRNIRSGKKTTRRLILDSIVQEIDIPTGLVLYQWDSLDHVPVTDSYQAAPRNPGHPWDYFHLNSIQRDNDGNLIISGRDTWAGYKISHQTGAIMWELGGKHSSFRMGRNTNFAFQHDIRMRTGDHVTVFDDGAGPPAVEKQSRALTLKLDFKHRTAAQVGQGEHHPGLLAFYEGNVQTEPGGNQFVGWGQQPYLTEFNAHGKTVFDARFVGPNSSYRAYRFPWVGTPASPPALAARTSHGHTTVYASWNGSTSLARWRVLAGSTATKLTAVASAGRGNFETSIGLRAGAKYVAVQALDGRGRVLTTSQPISTGS